MSVGKFSNKAINVRVPKRMRKVIDQWGIDNDENISVVLRQALRLGLIELGLLSNQNGRNDNNLT